jgi:hypothetical protein
MISEEDASIKANRVYVPPLLKRLNYLKQNSKLVVYAQEIYLYRKEGV